MTTFDFLHIDAKIENDRIVGKAGGSLGEMMQPYVEQFFGKLNELNRSPKLSNVECSKYLDG